MTREYDSFIKSKLCQGDDTLYRYYQNDDTKRFRARLARLYNTKEGGDNINSVVMSMVSASCRDIIYNVIGLISKEFRSMGDMIVTGGDAFNVYMKPDDRITTVDIDTKFVPIFKASDGKLITPRQQEFFGYLQVLKLLLWDYMGILAENYLNMVIPYRIDTLVKNSKVGKLLGLSLPKDGPWITRRYHLIRKNKQSSNSSVKAGDVLIDVELFAFDMSVRYFTPMENKIALNNLGGILDIALMRPGEVGYEVIYHNKKGISYKNPLTGITKTNPNVRIAGKKFLMEDLYIMQSLGLRPWKKAKDKKRMYTFASKVLGINVKSTDSFQDIFKKTLLKLQIKPINIKARPVFNNKLISRAQDVNPYTYEKYTTHPKLDAIARKTIVGLKGTVNNISVPGYKNTKSKYKFDPDKSKWYVSNNPYYIRDQYTLRPNKDTAITIPRNVKSWEILYGYNPMRNSWVPRSIIDKAAIIPLVGLKNIHV